MKYIGNVDFDHGTPAKAAVLLINLGTPRAPETREVRLFLRELLSDPRVVEIHRLVWWCILHLLVLNFRPRKSARAYRKVWSDDGSPLLVKTVAIQKALSASLTKRGLDWLEVEIAMCYGEPAIGDVLHRLHAENVQKILVLPLYPQYSATTTGAAFDAVSRVLGTFRFLPELHFVNSYHDNPDYIKACAEAISASRRDSSASDLLLFSFHGLPRRNLLLGDPYYCHCHASARLIAKQLDLSDEQWRISFQSRFGRAEWLQPYTEELLKTLPAEGYKNIEVFCPGFAVDCLETLEEIDIRAYETFIASGGDTFHYIPALNDSPGHVRVFTNLIISLTDGWQQWQRRSKEADERKRLADSRKRTLSPGSSYSMNGSRHAGTDGTKYQHRPGQDPARPAS